MKENSYILPEELKSFYDCPTFEEYHDCNEWSNTMFSKQKRSQVFHISIDHNIIGKHEKGTKNQVKFIQQNTVDEILNDMAYDQLIGRHHSFDAFAFAVTTVERFQKLEELQPKLNFKPIEVIQRTLQATTQWAVSLNHFPLKDHHVSRFPWANRSRLQEDVSMDTAFSAVTGFDGSNCAQVFFGLLSRCLNPYFMPSHKKGNIIKAYQDFMRYEGVPQCLH